MAGRVAVMRAGSVLQVDTAARLYENPAQPFVAEFVGDANLLRGDSDGERAFTALGRHPLVAPVTAGPVDVVVRPEHVKLRLDGSGNGVVRQRTYFGHDQVIEIVLDDGVQVRSRVPATEVFHPGERVAAQITGPVVAFPDALASHPHP